MTSDNAKKIWKKKKVGIYIGHCGGNISDHVNVAQVEKKVAGLDGVTMTHTNMFMCSGPGQELIREDIRETLSAAGHCNLEFIMKDTMTFRDRPQRLAAWVRIAKQEISAR